MKNTYGIHMGRLLLLMRNSIIINRNLILLLAAVFSALIILGRIVNALSGEAPFSYNNMFFLLLYISGFALTMSISRDLHDKRKSNTWLLLPASILEKFVTLLFLPTLLLATGIIIYMTIVSYLIEFGLAAFISTDINGFNPFSMDLFKGIGIYVAFQAPFLAGAIYFRKHAMSYTFLILFLWGTLFWVFIFVTGMYLLAEYIPPLFPGFSNAGGFITWDGIDKLYAMTLWGKLRGAMGFWKPITTIYYWFISPLLWWLIAFFSLKEMEQ